MAEQTVEAPERFLDLRTLIEKDWDGFLFGTKKGVATTLGWVSYHTLRSKGSASGYPDRTCWRERLLFVELKTEKNTPSESQIHFMTGIAKAGGEVYLWKPSDVDEAVRVLGSRAVFNAEAGSLTGWDFKWKPKSLWLPAGARRETLESAL